MELSLLARAVKKIETDEDNSISITLASVSRPRSGKACAMWDSPQIRNFYLPVKN